VELVAAETNNGRPLCGTDSFDDQIDNVDGLP